MFNVYCSQSVMHTILTVISVLSFPVEVIWTHPLCNVKSKKISIIQYYLFENYAAYFLNSILRTCFNTHLNRPIFLYSGGVFLYKENSVRGSELLILF